jgi:hypothetical protein
MQERVKIMSDRLNSKEKGSAASCPNEGTKKVKVKFTLEQATKAQRGSRGIAILFP